MQENGKFVLVIATILILLIVVSLIILFTVFQKKKNLLVAKQIEEKKRFEREIAETQIEIREETLRNISWELHDNIGQLLTLAKIQLQNADELSLKQVSETLTQGLQEVRALSKLINPDAIRKINLKDALQLEIDRFNRLKYINATLIITGTYFEIHHKSNIILFRILQEFFSNTIKHAKSKNLEVALHFNNAQLQIIAKDDGKGFDINTLKEGIGLINMQNRAKLIGATLQISSQINQGTTLQILYKNE